MTTTIKRALLGLLEEAFPLIALAGLLLAAWGAVGTPEQLAVSDHAPAPLVADAKNVMAAPSTQLR